MNSNITNNWRNRLLSQQQSDQASPSRAAIEFIRDDTSTVITRRSRTFNRIETVKRYGIKHNIGACSSALDLEVDVDNFYRQFLDETLSDAQPRDIYSVYINSDTLQRPIFLHHSRVESPDYEAFLNALYEVSQSNSSFLTHGEHTLQVNIVHCVRG